MADYGLDDEPDALRTLKLACEALDRCEEARKAIAQHGTTYADRFGAPKVRAEVAIERLMRRGQGLAKDATGSPWGDA